MRQKAESAEWKFNEKIRFDNGPDKKSQRKHFSLTNAIDLWSLFRRVVMIGIIHNEILRVMIRVVFKQPHVRRLKESFIYHRKNMSKQKIVQTMENQTKNLHNEVP